MYRFGHLSLKIYYAEYSFARFDKDSFLIFDIRFWRVICPMSALMSNLTLCIFSNYCLWPNLCVSVCLSVTMCSFEFVWLCLLRVQNRFEITALSSKNRHPWWNFRWKSERVFHQKKIRKSNFVGWHKSFFFTLKFSSKKMTYHHWLENAVSAKQCIMIKKDKKILLFTKNIMKLGNLAPQMSIKIQMSILYFFLLPYLALTLVCR